MDDIKHMEVRRSTLEQTILWRERIANKWRQEMEAERKLKEAEEEEKRLKEQKLKETFGDSQGEWEQDKAQMQTLETQRKAGQAVEEPKGAAAKVADAAGGI